MALKMVAKDISVTLSLILDPSGEQPSAKVTKMCHEIFTTLKILEESTQNANLAEIYVDLTKTSIRKDLRESDAPMVLWDLCVERRMRIKNLTGWLLF